MCDLIKHRRFSTMHEMGSHNEIGHGIPRTNKSIDNERKLWPIQLWKSYPSNLFPGPTTEDGHNLFLHCCFVDKVMNYIVKKSVKTVREK